MHRLKTVALLLSACLPVAFANAAPAGAEVTPVAAQRTVTVQGVATVPIAQGANQEVADNAYRQALAGAIQDGKGKAEFLLSKTGETLGAVQTLSESGGYVECRGGEEGSYQPYTGTEPDIGSVTNQSGPVVAAGAVAPRAPAAIQGTGRAKPKSKPHRGRSHKHSGKHGAGRRASARKSAAESCSLSAGVVISYAIG